MTERTDAEMMKAARRRLFWTQDIASAALGVSIAQISAIENGRSRLTKTLRILLAVYLDRSHNNRTNLPVKPWEGGP